MTNISAFQALSPTAFGDVVGRDRVMDIAIRPLWADMPRVAGPAYTVTCPPGDNLMLHAAIYRAPPGSIVVVEAGDTDYALAGGNVCAVAQRRGISAFVLDGVIRDLGEVRAMRFPVFARGVIPIPGKKESVGMLGGAVLCGGVCVEFGDIVVADEEGIVVVPRAEAHTVLETARSRSFKDATQTLAAWETAHRARIEDLLRSKKFSG